MYNYRHPSVDLGPCHECSEFLVDIGLAPQCPGCDGELVRQLLNRIRAASVAQGQPGQPRETTVLGSQRPLCEVVELRR